MQPAPRTVRTMCPMNCHPTLCGMEATARPDGGVDIVGDRTNPDSAGFLCMRGRAAHEIVGNPRRLAQPLMRGRRGGEWRPASWDAALDRIAGAMAAAAPEASAIWAGHGLLANDYGVGVKVQQVERFANLFGCQRWGGAMICWGMGGFGFGLTGALETSTKEDMGAHSELIVMWGANTASQANTTPHLMAAKARGARIVAIDIRRTEATALADAALIIRPGSDVALALAVMHVMIAEGLYDRDFVAAHTLGFDELKAHVAPFDPAWAAARTGLSAEAIAAFARDYATTRPAMIVAGGSSLHKGDNDWRAARAIACLPALAGDYGVPGGGMGPRHGAHSHGRALGDVTARDRRRPGAYIPAQMEAIQAALEGGRIEVLLTLGANMLSSFADAGRTAAGLGKTGLVVGYDIFMNEALERHADIVLPGTIWLEEVGCKGTGTHIHLSDRLLPAAGEARPVWEVLKGLASRLGVEDAYPWPDQEAAIDAVLDHPATGHATVAGMRADGGRAALNISHVAYPTRAFDTPSGRIEFVSSRAVAMGLPALPEPGGEAEAEAAYPLTLGWGRGWMHFHAFYDHGRALPTLATREPEPRLWISPADAAGRGVADGDPIRIHNDRGAFDARALVTDKIDPGAVWIHDGWPGLNTLSSGAAVLPEAALEAFHFTVGQASYATRVEVTAA